jgi:hypothetical protein
MFRSLRPATQTALSRCRCRQSGATRGRRTARRPTSYPYPTHTLIPSPDASETYMPLLDTATLRKNGPDSPSEPRALDFFIFAPPSLASTACSSSRPPPMLVWLLLVSLLAPPHDDDAALWPSALHVMLCFLGTYGTASRLRSAWRIADDKIKKNSPGNP